MQFTTAYWIQQSKPVCIEGAYYRKQGRKKSIQISPTERCWNWPVPSQTDLQRMLRDYAHWSAHPHHHEKRAEGEGEEKGFVNFVRLPFPHVTGSASFTQPKQSLQAGCVHVCFGSGAVRCRALTVALLRRLINRSSCPAFIVQLRMTIGSTKLRNRGSGTV